VTDDFVIGPPGGDQAQAPWTYFHVHLTGGFWRQTTVFNLAYDQTVDRFARPWAQNREVLAGGRAWSPTASKVTIYEGPRVTTNQRSLGQGWMNAVKFGEDVTDTMLNHPDQLAPKPPPSAAEVQSATEDEHQAHRLTLWGRVIHSLPASVSLAADLFTLGVAGAGLGRLLGVW
jgi:hypothetical protein